MMASSTLRWPCLLDHVAHEQLLSPFAICLLWTTTPS